VAKDLGHGPRLSAAEHRARVKRLHASLPDLPTKAQDREVRRRELDLAIDHRLGIDFPAARRDALRAIQERLERRRLRLVLTLWLRRLLPGRRERDVDGLAAHAIDAYASALSRDELESFLGVSSGNGRDPERE
jgi:hypothetical protein